ncbi:MAG: hypothetical protein ACE5G2_04320 [Candidatus Krumholzibacteriia bacterium]
MDREQGVRRLDPGLGKRWRRTFTQWSDLLLGRVAGAWWARLRALNVLLAGLSAGLLCGWATWFARPLSVRPATIHELGGAHGFEPGVQPPALQASSVAVLQGSRLFDVPALAGSRAAPGRNVTLSELCRNLVLQGVLGGDEPRAIIVNQQTQQSHNVGVGQFIGEIEIRAIDARSVTLGWKNETIELFL